MPVADTVRSFREILEGKYDDLPESAFYMKGSIDQVTGTEEKGEKDEGVEREQAEAEEREGGARSARARRSATRRRGARVRGGDGAG